MIGDKNYFLLLLPVLFFSVFFINCGVKAPPKYPLPDIPDTPTSFQVFQRGSKINFSWKCPKETVSGNKLEEPIDFEITMMKRSPESKSPDKETFKDMMSRFKLYENKKCIDSINVSVSLPDKKDLSYYFSVRAIDTNNRKSEITSPRKVTPQNPPLPPKHFDASLKEGRIVLDWEAPRRTIDRSGISTENLRYNIYRKTSTGGSFTKINTGPVSKNTFTDDSIHYNTTYSYTVRAFLKDKQAESGNSSTVEIKARDTFPPEPPEGLTSDEIPEGVVLFWMPGSEEDLAGYNIYRRKKAEGKFVKINEELIKSSRYTDTGIKKDGVCFYRITALDSSSPPNESPPSRTVKHSFKRE